MDYAAFASKSKKIQIRYHQRRYYLKRLQFERCNSGLPSESLASPHSRIRGANLLISIRHLFTELHKLPSAFQEPPLCSTKRGCIGQKNAI